MSDKGNIFANPRDGDNDNDGVPDVVDVDDDNDGVQDANDSDPYLSNRPLEPLPIAPYEITIALPWRLTLEWGRPTGNERLRRYCHPRFGGFLT
jgi:hypothetical protein